MTTLGLCVVSGRVVEVSEHVAGREAEESFNGMRRYNPHITVAILMFLVIAVTYASDGGVEPDPPLDPTTTTATAMPAPSTTETPRHIAPYKSHLLAAEPAAVRGCPGVSGGRDRLVWFHRGLMTRLRPGEKPGRVD
jgi:hypothetical protein